MADTILRELWDIKDQIGRECGHSMARLFERLKAVEKSAERPAVDRTSRRRRKANRRSASRS